MFVDFLMVLPPNSALVLHAHHPNLELLVGKRRKDRRICFYLLQQRSTGQRAVPNRPRYSPRDTLLRASQRRTILLVIPLQLLEHHLFLVLGCEGLKY